MMMRLQSLLLLLLAIVMVVNAFHQPAVTPSPVPRFLTDAIQKTLRHSEALIVPPIPSNGQQQQGGISSGLVSQLAELALKGRLAAHDDVSCQVTAGSSDLVFHGRVGPVTVKGKQWASRLGLTCRAIQATVDSCQLDVGRILAKGKLRLRRPAAGKAMIALDAADFGNFITHPLMTAPTVESSSPITFCKEGTHIEADRVSFVCQHAGQDWKCQLRRGTTKNQRAILQVLPSNNDNDNDDPSSLSSYETTRQQLTESLSTFFNEMVFELDGTSLSFTDMMVSTSSSRSSSSSSSPTVMFALDISVRKLPSRSAAF